MCSTGVRLKRDVWHVWAGTAAAVPQLLSPLTPGCPQTHPTSGVDCPPMGRRAGLLSLPAARPLSQLLCPVADGKPLRYIFCTTPNPCWCTGSKALLEGVFMAALRYESASPKPRSLQTRTDLHHREPRALPRTCPTVGFLAGPVAKYPSLHGVSPVGSRNSLCSGPALSLGVLDG